MIETCPVTASDERFLRGLFESTHPEVAGWPVEVRTLFLTQQFEAQQTGWSSAYPGSEHALILADGEPVGRIWAYWSADECVLVDLAVVPERRGEGIGTELVQTLLARADRERVPVRGHVERWHEAATSFFTRLGFRESGGDEIFRTLERPPSAIQTPSSL
jgi:GNAT superfamily N-acetyltransferase